MANSLGCLNICQGAWTSQHLWDQCLCWQHQQYLALVSDQCKKIQIYKLLCIKCADSAIETNREDSIPVSVINTTAHACTCMSACTRLCDADISYKYYLINHEQSFHMIVINRLDSIH